MSVEQVISAPTILTNGARANSGFDLHERTRWNSFSIVNPNFSTPATGKDGSTSFAKTGIYWIPAHPDDPSPEGRPCICCEDRYLMRTRMKRLRHPKAWSQLPPHRTSHVVSNVSILDCGDGEPELSSRSRDFTWSNCAGTSSATWRALSTSSRSRRRAISRSTCNVSTC